MYTIDYPSFSYYNFVLYEMSVDIQCKIEFQNIGYGFQHSNDSLNFELNFVMNWTGGNSMKKNWKKLCFDSWIGLKTKIGGLQARSEAQSAEIHRLRTDSRITHTRVMCFNNLICHTIHLLGTHEIESLKLELQI